MSDDMYEGGEWRCRVEEQWAREYREIGYEGDCHGYGVNGTDLHGYRHMEGMDFKMHLGNR